MSVTTQMKRVAKALNSLSSANQARACSNRTSDSVRVSAGKDMARRGFLACANVVTVAKIGSGKSRGAGGQGEERSGEVSRSIVCQLRISSIEGPSSALVAVVNGTDRKRGWITCFSAAHRCLSWAFCKESRYSMCNLQQWSGSEHKILRTQQR
jgi:hypothetical protein